MWAAPGANWFQEAVVAGWLDLPFAIEPRDAALYATESLKVGDGGVVSEYGVGAYAPVAGAHVQLMPDAVVGSLFASDNATLGDRSHVQGRLFARTINEGQAVALGGDITEFERVNLSRLEADPFLSDLPRQSFTINAGCHDPDNTCCQTNTCRRTLEPGTWGSVTVNSGGHLYLAPGTYVFDSLLLNSGSYLHLDLDWSTAPVRIVVRDNFQYRAVTTWADAAYPPAEDWEKYLLARRLLVTTLQTTQCFLETQFYGTVLAPNARLMVQGHTDHFGAFLAHDIETAQHAPIHHVPFPFAWDDDAPNECGDGIINDFRGEECDDGNANPGDGCSPTCRLTTCWNRVRDNMETDIDCGGGACGDGCHEDQLCLVDSDCAGGTCMNNGPVNRCSGGATCWDRLRNSNETDVDCGGGLCRPCSELETCAVDEDCDSHNCNFEHVCVVGDCSDGWKDQDETGVDCGGVCGATCDPGSQCVTGNDCTTAVCLGGFCQHATCTDGVTNGDETDTDCGGGCVQRCNDGQTCRQHTDCQSQVCVWSMCIAPTCEDGVRSGDETDVDCGGPDCPPCELSGNCLEDGDCLSSFCDLSSQTCELLAHCTDWIRNGSETDVDCGGGFCPPCTPGHNCSVASDCDSGVCYGGACYATGACTEVVAEDLGGQGHEVTVPVDGCVMVRDAYPSWWGSRVMNLQNTTPGSYPVPYEWWSTCAAKEGSGSFTGDWQWKPLGVTNSNCATMIDLQGQGTGTIKLRYYGG
jgi:hypothetical protein